MTHNLQFFTTPLQSLLSASSLTTQRQLTWLEQMGVVHLFEMSFENVSRNVKQHLEQIGRTAMIGPRDAFNEALKIDLISKAQDWFDMIDTRRSLCDLNSNVDIDKTAGKILTQYLPRLKELAIRFCDLQSAPPTDDL